MTEVGSAFVTLVPSAKGFGRSAERVLGGELPQVGDRQGKRMGARMSGAFSGILAKGVVGAAAGAGALVGTALFKGFGRLNAIDQATAKLSGLGHSAKSISKIMDNALSSVKGTAFGLDEAASVAASAVAAGVKPGADLQRTLSLVADAATIAGTDMGDMGAIFNKVAASNKVQMDVINQLHDAGVPALSLLAKQMGVTAAEASDMASNGQIDFATFQKAMESGLGGAAQKSGKTFSGAFKNMGAALGRLGASLLSGVFPKMGPLFGKITTALDAAGPAAKRVGAALSVGFGKAVALIQPVAKAIGGLFSGGGRSSGMTQLISTFKSVFASVTSIVKSAVSIIKSLWAIFGGTITTLTRSIFGNVLGIIKGAFTIIRGVFKVVASLLKGDWSGVWSGLGMIVSGAWAVIKGLVKGGWAIIKAVFKAGGLILKTIFVGIWNGLKAAAIAGWNKVWGFLKSIPATLKGIFSGVWDGLSAGLKAAINSVLNLPLKIPRVTLPLIGAVGGQTLIPRLAAGGIVSSPTVALIGEAGPEAVVPLSGSNGKRAASLAHGSGSGGGITRADLEWHVRALASVLGVAMDGAMADQLAFSSRIARTAR